MNTKKMKIGLVGCGAIGTSLSEIVKKQFGATIQIVAFCDIDKAKAIVLKNKIGVGVVCALKKLIALSDIVVEAASAGVSFDVAYGAVLRGKPVLIMSIGGILGKEKKLFDLAQKKNVSVYFPSGAICGIDGIKALSGVGITRLTLRTLKPPKALAGVDYVIKNKIDLELIKKDMVVFRGNAQDAVKAFPQNINVVALLSLASRGCVVPTVEIVASPGLKRNIHKIIVNSDAADLEILCSNVASPGNPKTSYLAILSAVETLRGISDRVRIGS